MTACKAWQQVSFGAAWPADCMVAKLLTVVNQAAQGGQAYQQM
jgi:hypothetical protein